MSAIPTPRDLPAEGNCYEKSYNMILWSGVWQKLVLVHGRPTLTRPPFCQFGHAWLETGHMVYDAASGKWAPRAIYYAAGNIDPDLCHIYTREQATALLRRHGHYGPWEGVDAPDDCQGCGERHGIHAGLCGLCRDGHDHDDWLAEAEAERRADIERDLASDQMTQNRIDRNERHFRQGAF